MSDAPRRGARVMSLVFRFALSIDDRKLEVANLPGDAIRMRAQDQGLDDKLAGGGLDAYEVMFQFAYRALRHHEEYRDLTWDEFLDRCEDWTILDDEKTVRPTGAGRSNEP